MTDTAKVLTVIALTSASWCLAATAVIAIASCLYGCGPGYEARTSEPVPSGAGQQRPQTPPAGGGSEEPAILLEGHARSWECVTSMGSYSALRMATNPDGSRWYPPQSGDSAWATGVQWWTSAGVSTVCYSETGCNRASTCSSGEQCIVYGDGWQAGGNCN